MKKRNNLFKIFMATVMALAMLQISTVTANETYNVTDQDSIVITVDKENPPEDLVFISKDECVEEGYEWTYVIYNESSDGCFIREMGYLTLDGIFLDVYDILVLSPVVGDDGATVNTYFYGANLQKVNVTKVTGYSAIETLQMDESKEYTLENNSYCNLYMPEGNPPIDYIVYDGTGEVIYECSGEIPPFELNPYNIIVFSASEPVTFTYHTHDYTKIKLSSETKPGYIDYEDKMYDLDGLKYTFHNKSTTAMTFESKASAPVHCIVYNSNNGIVSEVSNVISVPDIPAGGKLVLYLETETGAGETLALVYDSVYSSNLDVSTVRKAAASETKKVYIHFPEGSLVPSGLSKDSTGYYVSVKVTYVDTTLSQTEDTVGGFSVSAITDTSGLSSVNKWYVYNTSTGKPYTASAISGSSLSVVPLQSNFYTQLLSSYGGQSSYHIYAEWEVPSITKSGTYNLTKGVEYKLGSGKWTTNGDSSIYNGGMSFYVDSTGSYTLTLQ